MKTREARSGLLLAGLLSLLGTAAAAHEGPGIPSGYTYGLGGILNASRESGGLRLKGSMWAAAVGFGYRKTENWSFEAELIGAGGTYAGADVSSGSIWTAYNPDRTYSMSGIGGFVKGSLPLGAVRPYVRAGIGFYSVSMTVTGTTLFLLPAPEKKKSQVTVGPSVAAGLELPVSETMFLGAEARYLSLEESFGYLSSGRVRLGGPMFMAKLGREF